MDSKKKVKSIADVLHGVFFASFSLESLEKFSWGLCLQFGLKNKHFWSPYLQKMTWYWNLFQNVSQISICLYRFDFTWKWHLKHFTFAQKSFTQCSGYQVFTSLSNYFQDKSFQKTPTCRRFLRCERSGKSLCKLAM